jgi:sulfide:quinone oxidoreductase
MSVVITLFNMRHTWEMIENFKGGTAVFTNPSTPIKCGGAPQNHVFGLRLLA